MPRPTLGRRIRRRLRPVRARLREQRTDLRDVLAVRSARRQLDRVDRLDPRGRGSRPPNGDTAAVLHLYYADVWPALVPSLERLTAAGVDLYVTLPRQHAHLAPEIEAALPGTRCVTVPNRGRDVLPFLVVAEHLADRGYVAALKIHAKKSLHFGAGDVWRDQMIEQLVPSEPAVLAELVDVLHRPDTGVIGPRGSYFALSTYWAGNADTVRRLVESAVTPQALSRLGDPRELGFFAGTMFWTRLDAIRPLLHQDTLGFVREPTPKDGTLAHALERAMTVLPELLGRRQYDCDGTVIAPRAVRADPLPQWYRDATQAAKAEEADKATKARRHRDRAPGTDPA